MNVYAYIRTSNTIDTGRDTVAKQVERIEGFCSCQGWDLTRNFIDRATSGELALNLRPNGKALLKRLKRGDKVVIANFHRMFRSPIDAEKHLAVFKRKGVEVWLARLGVEIVVSESTALVKELVDSFTASEAALIGNRIKEAKAKLREEGKFQGGKIDFGYRVTRDGMLEEDPEGQEALTLMKQLRKEGNSYRAISDHIKKKYRGKLSISHEGVRRILARAEEKR